MTVDMVTPLLRGADAIDARDRFDPEERASHLNASEADRCIRWQWYERNAADKAAPQDWGYARRGSWQEGYMVSRLMAANVPLLFAGDDQLRLVDEEGRIACTPDGVVLDDSNEAAVPCEFKSVDPRKNRTALPTLAHVTQLRIAIALFRKFRAEFPEIPRGYSMDYGVLIYQDASNYNDILQFRVDHDPGALDAAAARAGRLFRARKVTSLPREGKERGGRECTQYCPFRQVCGVDVDLAGTADKGPSRSREGSRLTGYVRDYVDAREAEKSAADRKSLAGEKIKGELKDRGTSSMTVDGREVALTTRAGAVAYAKIVKEHLPDLDVEPYRGSSSEVLSIK